jgi:hypothetical protein
MGHSLSGEIKTHTGNGLLNCKRLLISRSRRSQKRLKKKKRDLHPALFYLTRHQFLSDLLPWEDRPVKIKRVCMKAHLNDASQKSQTL